MAGASVKASVIALRGILKSIKELVKKLIPDRIYLGMVYKKIFGKKIDWNNPKTYNEKLQWLKLYDRRPEYTKLVDKYEVKKVVSEIIGSEYIIPTLGVWKKFDDINFDELPDKFVLKCTHDSGGLVICKDKERFDIQKAKTVINNCLKRNYYWIWREWTYKNVKPGIIAEKYMEDAKSKDLPDYKFFAFDGVVKCMYIATDRQSAQEETKFDFFDVNFNHLDFRNGHPNAKVCPTKPEKFEEMIRLAEKLSKGIPHVRVDFYEVDGTIYFGEMTFFHWSGIVPFEPEEWDDILGGYIRLPKNT